MKPITLSHAQLDAALALPPVRPLSPLQVDHSRNVRTVNTRRQTDPERWPGEHAHMRALMVPCPTCGAPASYSCDNRDRLANHCPARLDPLTGRTTAPPRTPRRGRAR